MSFILASASPRRSDLLRAAGLAFHVDVSDVEEIHDHRMAAEELTILNALRKARDVSLRHPGIPALGADTLVYIDGEPLGKPANHAEAAAMLSRLSNRRHTVCTGIALAKDGHPVASDAVLTQVSFGPLDPPTIARYHSLVCPLDKAGAYGIQEHADLLGATWQGPLDNVIGLPVEAVKKLLACAGQKPGHAPPPGE